MGDRREIPNREPIQITQVKKSDGDIIVGMRYLLVAEMQQSAIIAHWKNACNSQWLKIEVYIEREWKTIDRPKL